MKPQAAPHLVESDNLWRVLLLIHLHLPLEQRVLAVLAAADLVVILLLQDGTDAAETADAAAARGLGAGDGGQVGATVRRGRVLAGAG